MDTLLQDLRSAFTVVAAMSFGLSLQNGPGPHLPAPRAERRAVRAARAAAPPVAPHQTVSWMDYIDFRRGSGDVLRWIGPTSLSEPAAPPDHPHSCGTRG